MTPEQTATTVLELAQTGRFTQIREMFAPQLRALVSAEALQAAWQTEVAKHGPLQDSGAPTSEPAGTGAVLVRIPLTFEHGELTLLVSVAGNDVLTGLQLAPAEAAKPTAPWQPPDYVDTETFDEQDVTVGSGALAVPGTISVPRTPGPWPAVALLAGSGPSDRDETVGRNKPFRDLAWGLASRGVVVLRFDKITYAHPDQVTPDFTVQQEYVQHAVAAVHQLLEHPAVDPARVFVLGHSLGGTVAPRVAAAEPRIAGLVILAGGTQPLHWAAVRQITYLASQDPAATSQPTIDAISDQARLVDGPGLSEATPPADLPFGVPAPYWLDLRAYRPVEVAAELAKPMFILQGARDYQVTVADDLPAWRAGLAGRPYVKIKIYDSDNHLFFTGTGPSTPAEYEPVQHMDPAVVTDTADWLLNA